MLLGGNSGGQQPMRSSQTMPHLNYTKDDIQEQYMSSKTRAQQQQQQKRSQSSGPKRRRLDQQQSFSDDEDDNFHSPANSRLTGNYDRDSSMVNDNQQTGNDNDNDRENSRSSMNAEGSSRSGRSRSKRKQAGGSKRSRSASLFSACFTIPNLSSMLPQSSSSSTQAQTSSSVVSSTKRSILAHLRLNSNRQHQRPISSSQTTGNLQQLGDFTASGSSNYNNQQNSSSVTRKHVSFEGQKQQASSANVTNHLPPSQITANSPLTTTTTATTSSLQQSQQPVARTGTGNNVILRNYQAHASTNLGGSAQQPQMTSSEVGNMSHVNDNMVSNNHPIGSQQTIYQNQQLAYQQPIRQQPQSGVSSNPIGVNKQLPATVINPQQQQQQQRVVYSSGRVNGCSAHPAGKPPTNTVYKRLPAVPMRTQATQTEITAYHLMAATSTTAATPPFASNTSSSATTRCLTSNATTMAARLPATPPSSSQTAAPSASQTPVKPFANEDSQLNQARQEPILDKNSSSQLVAGRSVVNKSETTTATTANLGASIKPDPTLAISSQLGGQISDGTHVQSPDRLDLSRVGGPGVEDDQGDSDADDCGNLNASLLASSCSSSSVQSLEGHDSTLANTLQCDLRVAATNSTMEDSVTNGSAKTRSSANKRLPVAKTIRQAAGGQQSSLASVEGSASIIGAHVEPQVCSAGIKPSDMELKSGDSDNSNARAAIIAKTGSVTESASDIEPPSEFKDISQRNHASENLNATSTSTLTSNQYQEDESMNMNSGHDNKIDLEETEMSLMKQEVGDDPIPSTSQFDRAPSPPSLSEASSQTTDTSMAQHIIDIGRSMEGRGSMENPARLSRQMSAGKAAILATELSDDRRSSRELEERIGRLVAETSRRKSSIKKDDTKVTRTEANNNYNDELEERLEAHEADNLQFMNRAIEPEVEMEVSRAATRRRKSGTSPAEQRRDDFLTLDELELQAASAHPVAASQIVSDVGPIVQSATTASDYVDLALVMAEQQGSKRSSTSTLSTRHHSYCSTDDFASASGQLNRDYNDQDDDNRNNEQANLDMVLGQAQAQAQANDNRDVDVDEIEKHLNACKLRLQTGKLSEIDESPTSVSPSPLAAPDTPTGGEGASGSSSDVVLPAQTENPKIGPQDKQDDTKAKETIKRDCGLTDGGENSGSKFTMAGGHKTHPERISSGQVGPVSASASASVAASIRKASSADSTTTTATATPTTAATTTTKTGTTATSSLSSGSSFSLTEGQSLATGLSKRVLQEATKLLLAEDAKKEPQLKQEARRSPLTSCSSTSSSGTSNSSSISSVTISSTVGNEMAQPEVSVASNGTSQVRKFAHSVVDDLLGETIGLASETSVCLEGPVESSTATGSLDQMRQYRGKHEADDELDDHNGLLMRIDERRQTGKGNGSTMNKLEQAPSSTITTIEDANQQQQRQQDREPVVASQQSTSIASTSSSSSSTTTTKTQTTSTTSASANSYVCCHGSDQTHSTRRQPEVEPAPAKVGAASRPKLPEKPAHLRAPQKFQPPEEQSSSAAGSATNSGRPEAAAAVAVTATSIAAAAMAVQVNQCQALPARAKASQAIGQFAQTSMTDQQPEEVTTETIKAKNNDSSEAKEQTDESDDLNDDQQHHQVASRIASNDSTGPALVSRSSSVCSAASVVQIQPLKQQLSFDGREAGSGVGRSSVQSQSGQAEALLASPGSQTATYSSQATSDSRMATLGSNTTQEDSLEQPEEQQPHTDEAEEIVEEKVEADAEPPRQSSSQELSTVSEVSEEISTPATRNDGSSLGHRSTEASRRRSSDQSSKRMASQPEANQQCEMVTPSAHVEPATENDLAYSDYTLRSQCSEAATSALTMASEEAVSTHQSRPLVSRQLSAEQRRRSTGSSVTSSTGTSSNAGSQSSRPHGMKSPVDCPYVHDILPLSPQSSDHALLVSAGGQSSSRSPQPLLGAIHKRLSHDDTMEAIEDDVEGEEQELQELAKQQNNENTSTTSPQSLVDIQPPLAFNNGASAATLPDPISEEPELALQQDEQNLLLLDTEEANQSTTVADAELDEGDEESSISISQRGVIVSQEVLAGGKRVSDADRLRAGTPSSSASSGSSSPTISSAALDGNGGANDGANQTSNAGYKRQVNCGDEDDGEEDVGEAENGQDDKTDAQVTPVKSISNDSGESATTQAILEHLSLHHQYQQTQVLGGGAMDLDEPAPTLENSRSIDPQHRRESWRKESVRSSAASSVPMDDAGNENAQIADESQQFAGQTEVIGTGTMKRKHAGTKSSTNQSIEGKLPPESGRDTSAAIVTTTTRNPTSQRQRGPPLSQLRASTANDTPTKAATGEPAAGMRPASMGQTPQTQQQQQQRQVSATDTSICSSCSCLEASLDLSHQEAHAQQQAPIKQQAISGQQESTKTQTPAPLKTVPSQPMTKQAGNWMSQEEGTVFTENYWLAHWLYISEHEESEIWRRAIDMSSGQQKAGQSSTTSGETSSNSAIDLNSVAGMPKELNEISDTQSERSFSSRYKSTTRKMIHRRATIEMYKRIMENNLRREKRVEISRSNGEFGFRIHGSRPVVVSAIERGTSAETCGLQVGDLIYAINETNILDMAHSDVVRLAHSADSSALILDLVPTNGFLRMSKYNRANNKRYEPTVTGFLMRLSPSTAQPLLIDLQEQMSQTPGASSRQRAARLNQVMRLAWRQRYFVLRSDNCLYWYKSPSDVEPYGGINLQGFSASLTNEFSEPSYVIRLIKYGGQPHYLGSNNMCDIQTWIDAINGAATEANQNDPYMKRTLMFARGKPNQIPEPDCCGYLYKFSHKRGGGAHWRAAYFVLKDACLYLFRDQQAESISQASAVYYLHGYKVRSKHIEHKKHTFELIPPNRKTIRPMFLMANNEIDKKRWIAALEYSIDRWVEID